MDRRAARLDAWLQRWLLVFVVGAIGAGIAAGEAIYRYKGLSPYLLGVTMAVATTRCRWEELRILSRRPSLALGLLVTGYGVTGLLGMAGAAAAFGTEAVWSRSFGLLWFGPAAAVSSLWTQIAGGNVALAVVLTTVSVAVTSAWITPVFRLLVTAGDGGGAGTTAPEAAGLLWHMTATVAAFVLLPAAGGLLAGHLWPQRVARARPYLGLAAKAGMLSIVFINTAGVRPYLGGALTEAAVMAALVVGAQVVGYSSAFAWSRWIERTGAEDGVALAYVATTRNTALAITLAALYLPAPAPLAPTVAFIVQEPLAAVVARMAAAAMRRRALAFPQPARELELTPPEALPGPPPQRM
ncbi:bile acid:sodium symporter [Carboxydochorda subterranea]|uniref:Bile acid:sodium symporter n=1 Tax=Carboxydichorda subterranea TaxID=3109565 RepID=A0ABZ1BXP1_9FIRM|nr:bile acid:sodium symporter [Limnochorda sp. L945t]WRP16858.1 bile acid:sodium symporter [Limnochorda sp. L945t]